MANPVFRAAGATVFPSAGFNFPVTLTPSAPAGRVAGDLLVLITAIRNIGATCATPAGWNLVSSFPKTSGTANGGRIYAFTRKASGTSADDASVVWSGGVNSTDLTSAVILAVQNAGQVLDGTVSVSDLASQTTTTTIPAFTTGTDHSYVLGVCVRLLDAAESGTVTNFTERVDASSSTATGHALYIADIIPATASSSGTGTITWSNTSNSRALCVTFGMQRADPVDAAADSLKWDLAGTIDGSALSVPWDLRSTVDGDALDLQWDLRNPYATLVLADGPVAYWRLQETSGLSLADSADSLPASGNVILGFTGPLREGNKAVQFPAGVPRSIQRTNATALQVGDSLTVDGWFKRIAGGGSSQALVQVQDSFELALIGDKLRLDDAIGGTTLATARIPIADTDTWHHFAVTKNGATTKLYLDGVDVTVAGGSSTLAPNGTWRLGITSAGSHQYVGYLSEVAVYDSALTAAQIQAHYTAGTFGVVGPPPLILSDLASTLDGSALRALWDLRTPIDASARALLWDLRSTVDGAADVLLWDLRGIVAGNAEALRWDLAGQIAAGRTLRWDLAATRDGLARSLQWDLSIPLSGDELGLPWALPGVIDGNDRSLLWDLSVPVAPAELVLDWAILGQIAADRSLLWDLAGVVDSAGLVLPWDVSVPVAGAAAATFRWDLAVLPGVVIAIPRALRWDISVPVDGSDRALVWTLRNLINGSPLELDWALAAHVAQLLMLRWELSARMMAVTASDRPRTAAYAVDDAIQTTTAERPAIVPTTEDLGR